MKPFISILQLFILFSCGSPGSQKQVTSNPIKDTVKATQTTMTLPNDTIMTIDKTPVWVQSPQGEIKADILVLPGWNFPKEKICRESDFCSKALSKGYRLILPDMMKSVYASKYFNETRSDYRKLLTLGWVTDTLIKILQKDYNIFTGKNNYLHGISTGARGAALVHLNTGKLFTKVVLLSGDYNNDWLSDDNLMKNTMGPYEQFKERWQQNDNPVSQVKNWSANLYIAHGTKDEVVETRQSTDFAKRIEELKVCKVISHFPEAGHDFIFWGGETEEVLKFLEE